MIFRRPWLITSPLDPLFLGAFLLITGSRCGVADEKPDLEQNPVVNGARHMNITSALHGERSSSQGTGGENWSAMRRRSSSSW